MLAVWGQGSASSLPVAERRCVVLPPGSIAGLWGANVAEVRGCEVMEGLAPTLTGSGLGGAHRGFHFRQRRNGLLTPHQRCRQGNPPPACQEQPQKHRSFCLFSLTHSPTHPLTHHHHSFIQPFAHHCHSITNPPTHPLTHPLTHSLTHPPTHSPTTHSPTHSPTHSLTHCTIHSITQQYLLPPTNSLTHYHRDC